MKRFPALFIAVIMVLCVAAPLFAFAFDASAAAASDTPASEQASVGGDVNITVMMPQAEQTSAPVQEIVDPLPTPTPKPNPNYPTLYPSDVYEFYDETSRQIIKTYELADSDNPAGISRDSFERDGWLYELADITKKENAHAATQEHTETVTVSTSTRDMEAILAQLDATMEYQSDDGYIGVLTLDIASIAVETAGTKKSSYTMTETREYPHLSSNDTSLVPKAITQNGVSYTLDSVSWQTQSSEAVDYDQIPSSYTATASYSATGSKTTVTGYTTTAQYTGTISKILTGRTVYTAYFIGQKIEPPTPEQEPETEAVPTAEPSPEPESEAEPSPEASAVPAPDDDSGLTSRLIVLIALALAVVGCGGYYFLRQNKNKKEATAKDEETV